MDEQRTASHHSTLLLVRVEEAARLLSLGRSTVYEMIASGELRAVKCGAARRIPVAALQQWIADHTEGGQPQPQ